MASGQVICRRRYPEPGREGYFAFRDNYNRFPIVTIKRFIVLSDLSPNQIAQQVANAVGAVNFVRLAISA